MVLQLHVARPVPNRCLLGVLPLGVQVNEGQNAQTYDPAHDDGNFGRDVARSVLGAEDLGTCVVLSTGSETRGGGFSCVGLRIPMMLPVQYPIRYIAAIVVFFVYPATLLLIKLRRATNGVGLACVR